MNTTKKIILLNAIAGSGKDFIADWLVKNKGYTKLAFATYLKKVAAKRYNLDESIFNTQEGKKSYIKENLTVRSALISLSKQMKRDDIYFFVKYIKDEIDVLFENNTTKIVISDYRFPEEYYYLLTYYREYLETISITRENHTPIVFDASETALKNMLFHRHILNKELEDCDRYLSDIFNGY